MFFMIFYSICVTFPLHALLLVFVLPSTRAEKKANFVARGKSFCSPLLVLAFSTSERTLLTFFLSGTGLY